MADLQHVESGQPFRPKAGDWNAFCDAARAHQGGARPPKARPMPGPADGGVVLVRNGSGAGRDQFDVLALGAPVITPADNESAFRQRPAFEGGTPSVPDDLGEFAVLLEPIPAGRIGRARAAGVCQVKVDVAEGWEDYEYADVADATGYLRLRPFGSARILWKASGTGVVWAVVRLGQAREPDGLWAEITGGDQAGGWTWTEAISGGSRNSTDDGKAYLVQDRVAVDAGTVVRLFGPEFDVEGTPRWHFAPPLPDPGAAGASQYKGLFVDADGRWHMDWPRVIDG